LKLELSLIRRSALCRRRTHTERIIFYKELFSPSIASSLRLLFHSNKGGNKRLGGK
jgi:hypothetical protein